MTLTLVTAPTVEPLHLDEVRKDRRLSADFTDDDAYLQGLIVTAREHVERGNELALITQTWRQTFEKFPWRHPFEITLDLWPVQSITSITYVDLAGAAQTLATSEYQARTGTWPARIKPAYGKEWPDTRCDTYEAITVEFIAGFGADWNSVPHPIRQAMFLLIGDMYELREETIVGVQSHTRKAVDALLAPYRPWTL